MAKEKTSEDLNDKNMFRSQQDLRDALQIIESVPEDNRSESVRAEQKALQDILLFKYDPKLKQQAKKLIEFIEKFDPNQRSDKTLDQFMKIHKGFDKRINELFAKSAPGEILGNDQQQPLFILSLCKQVNPAFDYQESGGKIMDQISKHEDTGNLQYFLVQACSSATYVQEKNQLQERQDTKEDVNKIKRLFQKIMEFLMQPHGIHFLRMMEKVNTQAKNHPFFNKRNTAEKNESQDIEMDVIRDHTKGKGR